MCLIIFDWQPDKKRKLTLASNRDEFYNRPSQNAHFWNDYPYIYGGRDLKAQGTWLAVSTKNRLAAVTNYREPEPFSATPARSRGDLTRNFLTSKLSASAFADSLKKVEYPGFNALFFDGSQLVYCTNRYPSAIDTQTQYFYTTLEAGRYGLSNHVLDTPWQKVNIAKPTLDKAARMQEPEKVTNILLNILANQAHAPDDALPDTGINIEWEKLLSPIFITSPEYGTRTSTVILIDQNQNKTNTIRFHERQYNKSPDLFEDHFQTIDCI